jgi:hypothetical protein
MVDGWLEAHAPGYDALTADERKAIKDFALLWSLFEAYALDEKGSANKIISTVATIEASGRLNIAPFAAQIAYFFHRYHDGVDFTEHYGHLNIRKNDNPTLIKQVLRMQVTDDRNVLSVLLIIIYRLRNNLFHGPKWGYGIAGQLDNFRNANAALMTYLERY